MHAWNSIGVYPPKHDNHNYVTHVHERIHADLARVRVVRVEPVRIIVVIRRAPAPAGPLQPVQDANLLRLLSSERQVLIEAARGTETFTSE